MRACLADRQARLPGRSGIALLEAVVALAILVALVGSVAYAARLALSVMTESMKETRLLFRVRRALDQAEEALSRCTRISVVAMTEDGWTLVGLENWFGQKAQQNADTNVGEEAEEVRAQLEEARRALQQLPPDFDASDAFLDRALEEFEEMVDAGMISIGDAMRLRDALDTIQGNVRARSVLGLGGNGSGYPGAWADFESVLGIGDPLVAAEPLVESDQVLFRQVVLGADGPEYQPPLDEPPASYYLRPMGDTGLFELVYWDGERSVVVADHLTGATFTRKTGSIFQIVLRFLEDDGGVPIERTEIRTIVLRVP
jgi:hypothetical protein